MTRKYLFLALTLVFLFASNAAYAQEQYLYWIGAINAEETRGNTIFRYSLDGGVVDTLLQAGELTPEMERYFYHITVDTLEQKIYWTDSGGTFSDGTIYLGAIMRASLDGSDHEIVLAGVACFVGAPTDIALDLEEKTLYWGEMSDCYRAGLLRTDMDGTRLEELALNTSYQVKAIALDTPNHMIYWSHKDWVWSSSNPNGILRTSLDNMEPELILSGEVCDIALAHTLSKIYWTPCTSNLIRRANLDGSEVEQIITGLNGPTDLTVDNIGKKIYWTETDAGKIRRANLDGSEVEDLLTGLVAPTSIALNFGWDVRVGIASEAPISENVVQNIYPNPVRESTTITFALATSTPVTLEIYDQLGRKIEVLASNTYPSGRFNVQWNPSGLANGVYFCRIETTYTSQTIALVLQR